ncbi:MAG: DinB family protein [Proteobacteria bacterium]|nr:DinB family protein [Pseudomonadota bacterium]
MQRVEQLCASLKTARRMTLGLLASLPPERWTWQGFPGQNHAAWIALHLAVADDWALVGMGRGEKRRLTAWDERVSGGPDADAARWPDRDEALVVLAEAHERYLAALHELTDADLIRPVEGALAEFAPEFGCLVDSHIWHEGFHGGQLSVVRKQLGLPPVWG